MAEVRRDIEKILELEKPYNCVSFIDGLANDSQVEYKYNFSVDLICNVEDDKEKKQVLKEMLSSRALSPIAAAYITAKEAGDNNIIKSDIEKSFMEEDETLRYIYNSVYYELKYNSILRYVGQCQSRMQQEECINRVYSKRYGNDCKKEKWFTGKCAVYTAITGNYDGINDPIFVNPEWDYYCFIDNSLKGFSSSVWKTIDISEESGFPNGGLLHRYAKTHPHTLLRDYDYTIYVDGNMVIYGDFREYISAFSKDCSMLAFPHPSRNSISDEARAIIALKKSDPEVIEKQLKKYKMAGYNDEVPLISSGCLIRSNHDELLNKTMEDWWIEIRDTGYRDQMSLGYVCWKTGYQFDLCNMNIYFNPYIRVLAHI